MRTCFNFSVALCVVLSLGAGTNAEGPSLIINGPSSARPGDIIILDASASKADHFDWLVDTSGVSVPDVSAKDETAKLVLQLKSLGFKVENPSGPDAIATHLILDDGRKLLLASYPGVWRLSLAGSNAEGVEQLPWKVVVSGSTPRPPDDPVPPDNPPAVPPFGLAVSVAEWKQAVPSGSRTQAPVVSAALKSVANSAVSGQFATLAEVDTALFGSLQQQMTAGTISKTDWGAFGTKLMDAITALKAMGKIVTPQDFGRALLEVVEGLE